MEKLKNNRIIFCVLFVAFFVGLSFLLNHWYNGDLGSNIQWVALIFSPFFLWSLWEAVRLLKLKRIYLLLIFLGVLLLFSLIPSVYLIIRFGLGITDSLTLSSVWLGTASAIGFFLLICMTKRKFKDKKKEFMGTSRVLIGALSFWSSAFFFLIFKKWNLFIVLITLGFVSDSCAYLFGRLGSRKVFRSSPNKTLEGFIGSVFIVTLLSCFLIVFWLKSDTETTVILTVISLFLAISANLGDLYYSSQKRYLGIKDYGSIFLGHGGFWDRFDSHTFVLSLANLIFFFLDLSLI